MNVCGTGDSQTLLNSVHGVFSKVWRRLFARLAFSGGANSVLVSRNRTEIKVLSDREKRKDTDGERERVGR